MTKPTKWVSGFIHVRKMSRNSKFFQGQGIVREFDILSGKNEILSKCQGIIREFYISVLKWKKGRDFLFQSNDFKYAEKLGESIFYQNWTEPILPFCKSTSHWLNGLQYIRKVYIVKKIFCLARFMRFREDFTAACSKLYLNKRKENQLLMLTSSYRDISSDKNLTFWNVDWLWDDLGHLLQQFVGLRIVIIYSFNYFCWKTF